MKKAFEPYCDHLVLLRKQNVVLPMTITLNTYLIDDQLKKTRLHGDSIPYFLVAFRLSLYKK